MPVSRWMIISKPLRHPFNDGTLVFCKLLLQGFPETAAFTYFGDPKQPVRDCEQDEIIETGTMGFSPSFFNKVKLLSSIFSPFRRKQPLHFFFTPNPLTSTIVKNIRRLYPKRLMVQTIMSSHGVEAFVPLLKPLDGIFVFSKKAKQAVIEGGFPKDKVFLVYPSVEEVAPPEDFQERRSLLYAGDLDKKVGDKLLHIARAMAADDSFQDWSLVVACRPKSEEDASVRQMLKEALKEEIRKGQVEILGEVDDMNSLFTRSALQLYLADHAKKKVDLPFVLLEGLAHGLGLISLDAAPINEIFELASERPYRLGATVDPDDTKALVGEVIQAIKDKELLEEWSRGARQLIKEQFSIREMVHKYEEIYRKLSK